MPHDRFGHKLREGDVVLLPMVVKEVYETDDYCNLLLDSVFGRKPDDQPERLSSINSNVVIHERLKPFDGLLSTSYLEDGAAKLLKKADLFDQIVSGKPFPVLEPGQERLPDGTVVAGDKNHPA